ncbi:MAG: hypothetical protein AB1689_15775, partial [Thermodesulfobacteriota bacterium]
MKHAGHDGVTVARAPGGVRRAVLLLAAAGAAALAIALVVWSVPVAPDTPREATSPARPDTHA